ncbi:MAG TPA: OmpA family protein [Gammaproteobacteria bacterium]
MSMRIAALAFTTVLLAACESAPSKTAWLMQGDAPWVGPDGKCMQLRPLAQDEKKGFCYDVMTEVYQKRHHYEVLDANEFAFLYPKVEPTAQTAYSLVPSPSDAETLANNKPDMATLPYIHQIYTALPFEFNKAHLSSRNRVALRTSFSDWQSRGIKVVSVAVTGHTDNKGSAAYNLQLSKWRAESVVYYLAKLGIPRGSIAQGGVGMAIPHPDARNDADNRYVDLRVWLAPPLGSSEKLATRDHEADAKGR